MKRLVLLTLMLITACTYRANLLDYTPAPGPQIGSVVHVPMLAANYTTPVRTDKKGVAWGCGGTGYLSDPQRLGAAWVHNWLSSPRMGAGLEAVPMIWDEAHLQDVIGGNSPWLMGFNEPDLCPEQGCITPDAGAVLWRQIESAHPERLLVAPVPSQFDPGWIDRFRDAYTAIYNEVPRLDALAAHAYYPTADDAIIYLDTWIERADAWGVETIWVTEYAMTGATDTLKVREGWKLSIWMEYNPRIARYAWYSTRTWCGEPVFYGLALMDQPGSLTPLGAAFSTYPRTPAGWELVNTGE